MCQIKTKVGLLLEWQSCLERDLEWLLVQTGIMILEN